MAEETQLRGVCVVGVLILAWLARLDVDLAVEEHVGITR